MLYLGGFHIDPNDTCNDITLTLNLKLFKKKKKVSATVKQNRPHIFVSYYLTTFLRTTQIYYTHTHTHSPMQTHI